MSVSASTPYVYSVCRQTAVGLVPQWLESISVCISSGGLTYTVGQGVGLETLRVGSGREKSVGDDSRSRIEDRPKRDAYHLIA